MREKGGGTQYSVQGAEGELGPRRIVLLEVFVPRVIFFYFSHFDRGLSSKDLGEKKQGTKKKGDFFSAVSLPRAWLERSRSRVTLKDLKE